MTSTEAANETGRSPGDSGDEVLAAMDKRTRKLSVAVTGVFAPVELALALTQYSHNSLTQNLMLLVVVLLVFAFQRHTAELSGRLNDDERVFRLLSSPLGRITYFLLASSALVILGLRILPVNF